MTSYEERLEIIPSDAKQAESYSQLLALWKEQHTHDELVPEALVVWDERVMAHLTVDERHYYLDITKLGGATAAAGKVNRLVSILLGRQNVLARTPPSVPHESVAEGFEEPPQHEAPDEGDPGEAAGDQQVVAERDREAEQGEDRELRRNGEQVADDDVGDRLDEGHGPGLAHCASRGPGWLPLVRSVRSVRLMISAVFAGAWASLLSFLPILLGWA
jgi:hypothetical protein